MDKQLVLYRNNSAYEQFLKPALEDREDFEMQVFPQGTPETEIAAWLAEHAGWVRGMRRVFLDDTCYEAGKSLHLWMAVSCVRLSDVFQQDIPQYLQEAAKTMLRKATVEESIAEIVRRLLAKETPTKVLLIRNHMADHNLFGLGISSDDRKEEATRDAEKLRACLEDTIGQPVWYLDVSSAGLDTGVSITEQDTVWVFLDRHFKSCEGRLWRNIPATFRQFQVPVENLIQDAVSFGIEFDTEEYSRVVREAVADW